MEADLSSCDYYTQTGTKICSYGCWEEPRCQTDEPEGGWRAMNLIGPLTAEEWMEFRYREDDEDDLLRCCANTSEVRDVIFGLMRRGPDADGATLINGRRFGHRSFRQAYDTMQAHGAPHGPDGRTAELLDRMFAWYLPDEEVPAWER